MSAANNVGGNALPNGNGNFIYFSLKLMPGVVAFERGPAEGGIGPLEYISRKVVGQLCFYGLVGVLIIEALVHGLFVAIGETVNSMGILFAARNVAPQEARPFQGQNGLPYFVDEVD